MNLSRPVLQNPSHQNSLLPPRRSLPLLHPHRRLRVRSPPNETNILEKQKPKSVLQVLQRDTHRLRLLTDSFLIVVRDALFDGAGRRKEINVSHWRFRETSPWLDMSSHDVRGRSRLIMVQLAVKTDGRCRDADQTDDGTAARVLVLRSHRHWRCSCMYVHGNACKHASSVFSLPDSRVNA